MLAREIMIPEPYVAAAGATSAEVALLMVAKDISVVPVVDNPKDRRYLGTISDRDIVTGCVAAGHDPKSCKVQTHARQDTVVLALDTELEGYKIERLDDKDTHIRSTIVVVDGNKRVVGFIPHPEFIQGIVDFYGKLDGKEMFWCWKVGEERIEHWHELESGYPGRQPIPVTVGGEG